MLIKNAPKLAHLLYNFVDVLQALNVDFPHRIVHAHRVVVVNNNADCGRLLPGDEKFLFEGKHGIQFFLDNFCLAKQHLLRGGGTRCEDLAVGVGGSLS